MCFALVRFGLVLRGAEGTPAGDATIPLCPTDVPRATTHKSPTLGGHVATAICVCELNEKIAIVSAMRAFRRTLHKIKGGGPFFGPAALTGRSKD